MMDAQDGYTLSRDHRGAARLNYQHYLWRESLGFNIHGSIPVDRKAALRIADIACGTGLWVAEVARALPEAQVDGLDVSLVHSPPAEWQPPNSRLLHWNMYTDPPSEWIGAYDIVHIRLVQLVIEQGDPRPTIRQMARLLKPGGYFQWDELDTGASYILKTEECIRDTPPLPTMERLIEMLSGLNPWIPRLKDEVNAESELYEHAEVFTYRDPLYIARAFFDMHLTKDEEMAETSFKGTPQGEEIIRNIDAMLNESKLGAVLCTPKLVLVCRKRRT